MANENSKPYFLLVFEKGDTMPTIISAETISEIYPDEKKQKLDIIYKDGSSISFEKVRMFKIVPAEHINYKM
nr:MAG TPA: hypothetical protein [Caudoviricetes sp.]